MIKYPRGDTGTDGVEALGEEGDFIGHTISVRIDHLIDALFMEREILPINAAIPVVILDAATGATQNARCHHSLIESLLLERRGEGDVVSNPLHVLADVQVAHFTAGRGTHIDRPFLIDGHSHGVRHIDCPRPLYRGHFRRRKAEGTGKQGKQRAHHTFFNPPRPGKVPSDRGLQALKYVRYPRFGWVPI